MLSPEQKRALYDGVAVLLPGILFMNTGFAGRNGAAPDWLRAGDRRFQYHFELVRRAFQGVELSGRTVLEIASGRGGNCYYVSHYTDARRVYGIEDSAGTVRACAGIDAPNAEFICGDLARFPFPGDRFDVVFAIERSRHYPSTAVLFSEIHRVLKPGGIYVQAEVRRSGTWDDDQSEPLQIVSVDDISEEVFQALERPDGLKAIFRGIESEANREVVEHILSEIGERRDGFAIGLLGARITRMVKGKERCHGHT